MSSFYLFHLRHNFANKIFFNTFAHSVFLVSIGQLHSQNHFINKMLDKMMVENSHKMSYHIWFIHTVHRNERKLNFRRKKERKKISWKLGKYRKIRKTILGRVHEWEKIECIDVLISLVSCRQKPPKRCVYAIEPAWVKWLDLKCNTFSTCQSNTVLERVF